MRLRTIARNAAVVFATIALVYLVWVFRQALVLFVFSLAIAAAARPYVETIASRGVKRSLAILLVFFVFVGLLITAFVGMGTELLRELQVLGDSLARAYDTIWSTWPEGTDVQKMIVQQLPAPADLYESFSPEQQNSAFTGLFGFTVGSANFIGQLVTVLILSIYWSFDRVHFERLWLSVLPVESRARARDMWRNVESDFGSYVRSEVLQSILATLLLGLGFWGMGMPYPLLLAVFGGLVWLIPWLGGVLAVIPALLSGLSVSSGLAIFGAAYVVGVLFFLEFFVEPRFIRRGQFSSLLSILLIIALVEPFGLLGLIVAPPLAAAIELVVRYNLLLRTQPVENETVERISQLRARLLALRDMVDHGEGPAEPQTISILRRLEALVERAEDALEKQGGRRQPPASRLPAEDVKA